MRRNASLLQRFGLAAAFCAWLLAMGVGLGVLSRYKNTAGRPAAAPDDWPASAQVRRAADRPTLVLFAHPKCVCTRASLAEFQRLLEKVKDRVAARVLFIQPSGTPDDFVEGELLEKARGLPGVEVFIDRGGAQTQLFGSATSGQVMLFSRVGSLLFSGGITNARGHEGRGAGTDRILALLQGDDAPKGAPVFGCALEDSNSTLANSR